MIEKIPRVTVVDSAQGRAIGDNVALASGFWSRFLGLMGRDQLAPLDGLWLPSSGDVHTGWMRFPIDIIFLGHDGRVLAVCDRVPPWRLRRAPRGNGATLELPEGASNDLGVGVDSVLVAR